MRRHRRRHTRLGLTLVELLVAITLIVIVIGVLLGALDNANAEFRAAQARVGHRAVIVPARVVDQAPPPERETLPGRRLTARVLRAWYAVRAPGGQR